MKLKKIASLMLAGVMAVSMLTACGDNISDDTTGDDNTNTTPAATYSSTFGAALKDQAAIDDRITMADNAELTADLNKAIEKLSAATIMRFYNDVDNDYVQRTAVNIETNTLGAADLNAIVADMDAVSDDRAFSGVKDMLRDFAEANKPWEDKTVTMLFAVDSTVSANAAVAEVADVLNDNIGDLAINNVGDDNDQMHYSYTGSVSVATKTLTENHGMGMHIVAVQITRSAHA